MLYPTFGNFIGETKVRKGPNLFTEILGEPGLYLYKDIFDRNNKEAIIAFFQDPIVRKFWPVMIEHSERETYFKTDDASVRQIKTTLQHITYEMDNDH